MIRNYSDEVVPMVERALERYDHQGRDSIRFEVMFGVGASGPGTPLAFQAVLLVTMPSPIVGNTIFDVQQVPALHITADQVDAMVQGACERLRAERTRQLAPGNGHHQPTTAPPPT